MALLNRPGLVIASRYSDLAVCLFGIPYLAQGENQVRLFNVECFKALRESELHLYGWYSLALKAKASCITRVNENLIQFTGEVTDLPGQYYSPAPTNFGGFTDWLRSQVEVNAHIERVYLEGIHSPSYMTTVYPL